MKNLKSFFTQNPRGAVAFSGGVDSALLVWAAATYGKDWHAYYVNSAFQPAFELEDAEDVADLCGLPLTVLSADVLTDPVITSNPADRCYHCKNRVFSSILSAAKADGYSLLIDGTNASDEAGDRPGMRALRELSVRSPLRECGITKPMVRELCHAASLPVWNKPSYACLATRVPTGETITAEKLEKVEQAEDILSRLGYTDFRCRLRGENALLQFTAGQQLRAMQNADALKAALQPLFSVISIDPNIRKASV